MIVLIDDYLLGDKDVYRLRHPRPGDLWQMNDRLVLKVCNLYSEHLTYSTVVDDVGNLELYPESGVKSTIKKSDLAQVLRDLAKYHKPISVVRAHRPILIFPDSKIKRRYVKDV